MLLLKYVLEINKEIIWFEGWLKPKENSNPRSVLMDIIAWCGSLIPKWYQGRSIGTDFLYHKLQYKPLQRYLLLQSPLQPQLQQKAHPDNHYSQNTKFTAPPLLFLRTQPLHILLSSSMVAKHYKKLRLVFIHIFAIRGFSSITL